MTGGGDNTTRIWSVEGRLVHTMTPELGNHNSHTTGLAVRRAEDGEEELITGSYDETIRFWRNQGTKKHFEHKMTMVYCMAVSPDERCVAAGNNDGKIRMIDAADGTHRAMLLGPKTAVLSIDWSPDSKSVCCGSRDERAYVWKLGNLKIGPEEEMRLLQQEYHRFDGHKNDVSGIAWQSEEKIKAVRSSRKRIRFSAKLRRAPGNHFAPGMRPTSVTTVLYGTEDLISRKSQSSPQNFSSSSTDQA